MNIFTLIASLTLESSDFTKGIDDAKKDIKKLEKQSTNSNKAMKQSWLKLIPIIVAMVTAVVKATKALLTYNKTISDNSKKIGISAEDYQLWSAIVQGVGGDTDDLNSAFSAMNDLLDQASEGEGDATAKLSELGLTYSDFAGLSPEEAFEKIVTALQNMADGTEKTKIIQDLFGDDIASVLTPILSNNSDSVEALKEYYESLGVVMSDDTVNGATSVQTAFGSLWTQIKGFGSEILSGFYPALQAVAGWMSSAVKWMSENKAVVGGILIYINTLLLTITATLWAMDKIPVVTAISLIVIAIAGLVTGIVTLVKNWDSVEAYFTEQYNSGWLHWMKTAVEAVKGWFQSLVDFFKNLGSNITDIFSKIWDGLVSGFKAFCNFFIDGINALISGLNKISFTMPDWMGGKHFGINIPLIPRLQKGEDFVPKDFYPAYLDYGERVLTRKQNEKYSALGGVDGMETLVNGIGGAVSQRGSVRSTSDIKVYVQIGDKDFKNYTYKVVDTAMKQKGYKSLRKVGSYD